MNRKMLAGCLLGAGLAVGSLAADAGFMLRDGGRVVFLGDSITEQKLFTTYIEAYTVTRFPQQQFHFWNSGWGGDTAWLRMRSHCDEKALFAAQGAEQQKLVEQAVDGCLTRDVLFYKPTVVLVDFGMNDHNYEAFREDIFRAYVRSQTEIVNVLTQGGARVVLLTPQPIEERRADPDQDPRNQSLRKFGAGLKEVAARQNAMFIDQFEPYMGIMLREHAGKTNACIGGGDAVHPGPVGHTLMAAFILKGLDAPALVSSAALDVTALPGNQGIQAARCTITNAKFDNGVLSFDRADECLPMPIDARAVDALKLAPVLNDLSRYELKVTGLTADKYDVTMDGEPAATVSREELARGWNLTTVPGPITKQTQELLALLFKKGEVGGKLWSVLIRPKRAAQRPGLEAEITDLEARIAAACQPKPHHVELKPASGAPTGN